MEVTAQCPGDSSLKSRPMRARLIHNTLLEKPVESCDPCGRAGRCRVIKFKMAPTCCSNFPKNSRAFRYTRGVYPGGVLMSRQGSATWGLAVSEHPHWSMR